MKKIERAFSAGAAGLLLALIGQSCAMEAPFGEGSEGTLSIVTKINGETESITTRALSNEQALRENCVIYIENDKGVIRKFKGIDEIPSDIRLRVGSYVAEGWAGDSVSASFDKKFYRGYQRFEVQEGSNSLTLNCNIANTIVSVSSESASVGLSNLKIEFSHSRGSLVFDKSNIASAKGYFMMPSTDKDIDYVITGKKADGSDFSRKGVIENVQRAHEYRLEITAEDRPNTSGGALIQVTVVDIPVIDVHVDVFTAPVVRGEGFDIDRQVVKGNDGFTDVKVYVRGYFGLASVLVDWSDNLRAVCPGLPANGSNILSEETETLLASLGITTDLRHVQDDAQSLEGGKVEVDDLLITFTKSFLDNLPDSDTEFYVDFDATDGSHKRGQGRLRIANTEAAVEHLAPVGTAPAPDPANTPMAIRARTATLQGYIFDDSASGYGIRYREEGTQAWSEAYPSTGKSAPSTRAGVKTFSVTLSGLKPGTTYEYCSFAAGCDDCLVQTFTTEGVFAIPNASFEDWSTYSASTMLGTKTVILPGLGGNKELSYWGSGNEGAATANITLTDKSTDMLHSGTYSARLKSNAAMGVIAAGNIFVGHYVKTDGTNGVLSLGRPYNGSHPTKVKVYANYRPGSGVTVKGGNEDLVEIVAGGTDHGQIYVAFTDEPVEIRTNPDNRKLFDPADRHVLGYGQVTWKEAFGPDGGLAELEIPVIWNDRATTQPATHLVIVASACKFGDFFSGSKESCMYLDDFELVYDK